MYMFESLFLTLDLLWCLCECVMVLQVSLAD